MQLWTNDQQRRRMGPTYTGITVLPRFLSDEQIARVLSVSFASQCHSEEEGHYVSYEHLMEKEERDKREEINKRIEEEKKEPPKKKASFRAQKPHHMPWLADVLQREVSHLGQVDPYMQVYRLSGARSAVPLHVDEDFPGPDGSMARYSVLVRLNSDYVGGDTRFGEGEGEVPFVSVGGCVVFRHNVPHEGLPLVSGVKFVLKTDLFEV